MSKTRVLLVDDEEEFTRTLAERLEARGLSVEIAHAGELAIEKVQKKSFEAVVLDLAMPGLNGIETLRTLKKIQPNLPIILLTGQATVQATKEAIQQGALDLLEKPTDIQQLLSKIEQASSQKALLVEKQMEEQIADILKKRGW